MVKNIDDQVIKLSRRFPELTSGVEARRTLAWLQARIAGVASALDDGWNLVRSRMEEANSGTRILRLYPIENDFWICKRANPALKPSDLFLPGRPNSLNWSLQWWQPPDDWKEWPSFNVESEKWLTDLKAVRTTPIQPDPTIEWQGDVSAKRGRAMQILFELASRPSNAAESAICNQASAWLDTSLGRIGKLINPNTDGDIDPQLLLGDLASSVLPSLSSIHADMVEVSLQTLYGSVRDSDQSSLVAQYTPGGQSHEWRDYFQSFSRNLSREHTLMAVQLAALALRSESAWEVLEALQRANDDNEGLLDLSVCIRRRWILSLKALAWVELSLHRQEPFDLITPADLMCFAIDALLPIYPRPLVGISHRSADAKPMLIRGKFWGSNEITLDATFRPVWQTNRAMLWSLFASTPVLCKVRSDTYDESVWCRVESEMFKHLVETADFMDGRRRLEIDLEEVNVLEKPAKSWSKTHRVMDIAAGIESPPMEILKFDRWQGALIRAVGIARFVHRFMALANISGEYSAREIANRLLDNLYSAEGEGIPDDDLMGITKGWHVLSRGLRVDAALLELEGPLAQAAGEEEPEQAQQWFDQLAGILPNLSESSIDLCDLLAAIDWRENLEPLLRDKDRGTNLEYQAGIIDLRRTSEEKWATDPGWTVARGLVFLRLPYPIIIRQLAGQNADKWPFLKELDIPIFTEHLPEQRLPQSEVFFSLGGPWPAAYYNTVIDFVEISPHLTFACSESLKLGTDPVMVRADGGLSALSLDGEHGFEEWLHEHLKQKEESSE